MSTIASPRSSSVTGGRRIPTIISPAPSTRTSQETVRSNEPSPNRSTTRGARKALREYYNLPSSSVGSQPPPALASIHDFSAISTSALDSLSFSAQDHVKEVLASEGLEELLRGYNRILGDIRALDAEKKALVYDNYSKLITATETIRRMREDMRVEMGEVDEKVRNVWERADGVRMECRERLGSEKIDSGKRRRQELVVEVLETPGQIRELMKEGREEDARALWEPSLKLLKRWRERKVGGEQVQFCIDDGESALRGEPPSEKSWESVKKKEPKSV